MKHTTFYIGFQNAGERKITAFSPKEAAILGMAEQIREGKIYDILYIVDEHNNYWEVTEELRLTQIKK